MMLRRTYTMLPDIPDAGLLDRYLDTFGVIVPLARTNLVTNPSFETNTTGWSVSGGGASIARTTADQYHGAYSLGVTAANFGVTVTYQPSLTSGTTYAFSCKVRNPVAGRSMQISFNTSLGVLLSSYAFTSTGKWQWVWVVYQAASTATHQLNVTLNTLLVSDTFYVDGVQLEAITDGYNAPTTYLDGDQAGLVPNQFPVPYGWNGTPHASSSYRTGQTRAGGRIVRLRNLGFLLSAIIGLGMTPPQHQALTFAQLDGGQYQNTLKPPRTFSLAGRVAAITPNGGDSAVSQLSRLLDRDLIAQRQPLVLTTQAQDCGNDCGERVSIPALYSGGLEGSVVELPTAQLPITFTQYIPYVQGHDQGAALTVQQSVSNANRVLRRSPSGAWAALGTGASGGSVYAVARGLDGLIYLGGDFTSFNGVANTARICSYDPVTGTVAALGTGTASGLVIDLQIAPDGKLWAVGTFANMGGVAAADFVGIWDPVALSWSAPGTPPTVSATGPSFPAGGAFDNLGRFYLAPATTSAYRYSAGVWTTLATGTVQNLSVVRTADGNIIFGTNGAGTIGGATNSVVRYNVAAGTWSAYGGAIGAVTTSLVFDNGNFLYIGGNGSLSRSNGVAWVDVVTTGGGGGFGIYEVAYNPLSALIYASGDFRTALGVTYPDSFLAYNGAVPVLPDVDLPGTAGTTVVGTVRAFDDGSTIVAFDASGTATAAAQTTATNSGTIGVYPTLTMRGPSSGTSRIYRLENTTSGATIYFNYTIQAGETAVLTLNPTNITFVSTFSGNILNTILPGSNLTNFLLQPGANTINFLADASSVTAVLQWQIGYGNLSDALYQAVAP